MYFLLLLTSSLFQFQNGSIITFDVRRCFICFSSFQFQNGSIITQDLRLSERLQRVSIPKWFNYYKAPKVRKHLAILFQFQNGSIITKLAELDDNFTYPFQFQNGSIITPYLHEKVDQIFCFNSKMVQLLHDNRCRYVCISE